MLLVADKPSDLRVDIPSKTVLVIPSIHTHMLAVGNVKPDFVDEILRVVSERANDITIIIPLAKTYFDRASKILSLQSIAEKYGARLTTVQMSEVVDFELPPYKGQSVKVKVLADALEDSIAKVVVNLPTAHNQVILYLSIPTLSYGVINPKDWVKLYHGLRYQHQALAHLAKVVKNVYSFVDGRNVVEGDGPIRGFQRFWGLNIAGDDCGVVDYVTAYGLGLDPMDIGYIYFYFNGRPKVEVPELVEKNRVKIKLTSNVGLLMTWKME